MAKKINTEWRNRIVSSGTMPASQFVANPSNWRIHPKAQREALSGVLNEVGWVQNVAVALQRWADATGKTPVLMTNENTPNTTH